MNPRIMHDDPGTRALSQAIVDAAGFATDGLYVYTCAVGASDGLKELCIAADKKIGSATTHGILLSTNVTGSGEGEDWNLEWGTRYGFMSEERNPNQVRHLEVCLFRSVSGFTFKLIKTQRVRKMGKKVRRGKGVRRKGGKKAKKRKCARNCHMVKGKGGEKG
jgi:hypothetical protein